MDDKRLRIPAESMPNISRKPLPASIMEILTNDLLSGELKPGDRLPTETELAKKLGVGRNSVREAIKMLSAIGVVKVIRGSGIYIADSISSSALNPLILGLASDQGTSAELTRLRLLIDTGAAELALEQMQDMSLERLQKINTLLEEEGKKPERNHHQLRDLDLAFHMELYRISGNSLLAKIGEAIYTLFRASIEKTVEADPEGAYQNHQRIIDALKTRDVILVRKSVRDSLSFWMRHMTTGQEILQAKSK
jgi:GntR family transcriptional repressor for pyruvate dehydrogenase complex